MIGRDKVETKNWNIPFGYGQITLGNLRPHAKNPTIANFFAQLGIVEELGNGTRTMFKYVPLISGGKEPLLEEEDEFRVCIPYMSEGLSVVTTEKTADKILRLITENPRITNEALAEACELTADGVYYHTKKLREVGRLVRKGGKKEGYWEVI